MNISKGTIVRTILLIIVVINMGLSKLGYDIINVTENEILIAVEYLIEIGIIMVAWWKNNSYTQNALKADEFLKNLKNQ